MWYLAEILLAEPARAGSADSRCESCNVVFSAATAVDAHGKAVVWGTAYAAAAAATMHLLGVTHLTSIGDELGDGVEICGRYFDESDPWTRIGELVPPPDQLEAIRWEVAGDTPLNDLLSLDRLGKIKRRFGERDE